MLREYRERGENCRFADVPNCATGCGGPTTVLEPVNSLTQCPIDRLQCPQKQESGQQAATQTPTHSTFWKGDDEQRTRVDNHRKSDKRKDGMEKDVNTGRVAK